jgi:hypothetical protein
MTVAQQVEVANAQYAASFTKGDLALPPQRYSILFYSFLKEIFDKSSILC